MEFYVYELQKTIQAKHRPIVIITSNNEKELPDAFLRRCFFHYIRFPEKETMQQIVAVHYPDLDQTLLDRAMKIFYQIRKVPGIKKKPSTSELIDWIKLILSERIKARELEDINLSQGEVPPLSGALLKNEQDFELIEQLRRWN
jgi:MoxR-like ATPase